jgi:hypothetical protein
MVKKLSGALKRALILMLKKVLDGISMAIKMAKQESLLYLTSQQLNLRMKNMTYGYQQVVY